MRWAILILALTASAFACANRTTIDAVPHRLTPPATAIVIELDVPDWTEVCIRTPPAFPMRYSCLDVWALRQAVQPTLKAN